MKKATEESALLKSLGQEVWKLNKCFPEGERGVKVGEVRGTDDEKRPGT